MHNVDKVIESNYLKWKDKGHFYEKLAGKYQELTYGDFIDKSQALAEYLIEQKQLGKTILIYGKNSNHLLIVDYAVLNYVGISVCVPKEWQERELLQTMRMLDISCVIFDEEKRAVINRLKQEFSEVLFLSMESMDELEKKENNCIPRDENICCKIVFSSGTTSNPKAVMLSKKNIFAGIEPLYKRCPVNESDVDYMFLPMCHTYGEIYNFLYSLVFGFSLYLCSDISKMSQEILEVNPTIFCGVPVIYRNFYEGYGDNIGRAFGSRIQYLFCGGANLDMEIRRAYFNSGLNLLEAYALSETASTFAIKYPGDPDLETVGTIAENLDVKLINTNEEDVGEIVVKGDNVFMGYAGNETLTKEVFTEDGYFKTGDLGYIKKDTVNGGEKLYVTGRIKKVLVGENGEKVDPDYIEELICEKNANINKVVVYMQDGQLGCHVYLDEPQKEDWDVFFKNINKMLSVKIKVYDIVLDSVEKRLKQ